MRRFLLPIGCSLAVACFGIGQQPVNAGKREGAAEPVGLKVQGAGLKSLELSGQDLAAMARKTLVVKEKDDVEAKYEGVTVQEILTKAGMGFGQALRGPRMRDYLLAEAGDGYGVVFALPEISEEFSDRVVIVADKINGGPITGRDGPFKIIVSDEKKHARWVRDVRTLTVRSSTGDEKGAAGEKKSDAKPAEK